MNGPQSDAWMSALVESSSDAILSYTFDGQILTWNPGAAAMFGYTADEVIGESLALLAPTERVAEQQHILQSIQNGKPIIQLDTVRVRKNGERFPVSKTISPVRNGQGSIVGAVAIIQDITERKQFEERIRQSEERYRLIFSSIDEGYALCRLVYDEGGRPIDWCLLEANPAFIAVSGLVPPTNKEAVELSSTIEAYWLQMLDAVIQTGKARRFEYRAENLSRWFDVYLSRAGQADRHQIVVIFTDVTVRKQAEEEVQRALRVEQTAHAKAEAALHTRDQFLSIASHELRTPLTSLLGYVSMLQASPMVKPEMVNTLYKRIVRQGQRLDALVGQLLDMSRLQQGQFSITPQPLDLTPIVAQVVDASSLLASAATHPIMFTSPDQPVMIRGDAERLEQVIQNLVSNAIKYSPDGGAVEVKVAASSHDAVVEVKDEGIGIPQDAQTRLFEPFYRAPNVGTQASGFGLGLHIVSEIVARHDGRIEVESVEGQGSTFRILLPLLGL